MMTNEEALKIINLTREDDRKILLKPNKAVEEFHDALAFALEKQIDVNKVEKELGVSMEVFFKALKKGIWSKEHCNFPNKHYRQESPFTVTPSFEDGKWVFYFDEHAYGDTGCRSAYIFKDDVDVADYGKTWFLTKSEAVERSKENDI